MDIKSQNGLGIWMMGIFRFGRSNFGVGRSEGIPIFWDIISSMGCLSFSTQDASPCIWGSWMDWIGVIRSCGVLVSQGRLWGIIGSWDGLGSWNENERLLLSWLKRGSCSGMEGMIRSCNEIGLNNGVDGMELQDGTF